MSAIEGLFGFGGSALGVLLPFLFVLTVVVFFHELGHFSIARLCGVAIETFSIGFGPELYGWNDKHGTRWRIAAIPFGGYVKFAGDQGPASNPDDSFLSRLSPEQRADNFHFKPVWQRMAVVVAGPLANFVLSIVVFALIFMIVGQQISVPRVESVQPGSAAEQAGFQPNDLITGIDGHKINSFFEMQRLVMSSPDQTLVFQVQRDNQTVDLTAVPTRRDITDRFGNVHHIGLLGISRQQTPDDQKVVRLDPASALMAGTYEVYFVVERTLTYLGRVAGGIESGDQLSGPLRIAQVSGQAAELGFMTLVNLVAVLSVSVGLVNLFPVPLLDGGHLLFYAFEAIRGRPLSARTQEFGFRIGLAAVISLMLFSTWNDLVQLRVVHFLTG
jgi:regulator of sigma E protease